MRRLFLVLILSLVFVGAAWALNPTSVTVDRGKYQRGDAGSLYAADGNTLDVASGPRAGIRNVVFLSVAFSSQEHYLHYAIWAEPQGVSCKLAWGPKRTIETALTVGRQDISGVSWSSTYPVRCKAPGPFTIHVDEITVGSS